MEDKIENEIIQDDLSMQLYFNHVVCMWEKHRFN